MGSDKVVFWDILDRTHRGTDWSLEKQWARQVRCSCWPIELHTSELLPSTTPQPWRNTGSEQVLCHLNINTTMVNIFMSAMINIFIAFIETSIDLSHIFSHWIFITVLRGGQSRWLLLPQRHRSGNWSSFIHPIRGNALSPSVSSPWSPARNKTDTGPALTEFSFGWVQRGWLAA